MLGRTLANSNFKASYDKASVPKGPLQLGATLSKVIEAYCIRASIPFAEDEGEHFFELLQEEAMVNKDDPMADMAQRMWTSALQLRGREFCFILNDAVREDRKEDGPALAKVVRSINELCVTINSAAVAVHPPDNVCIRGGGFDDKYRSFFVTGRKFRQPSFLATSFSGEVADGFIARSGMQSKVRWLVRIDPARKCVHVNLVKKTNVEGEEEYLFAPYSVFTVASATWNAGTTADPHIIVLQAAVDNKEQPEDLPLAPWS
jgi:hypothetical protein